MANQEFIIAALAVLVVVALFKEKVAAFAERARLSFKFRGKEADYHASKIMAAIERLSSEVMLQRGDLQTIETRLDSLHMLMKIATGEDAAKQASLYMEGLGAVARSSNATLEKQERIEALLVQLVGSLKGLTE